MDKYLSEWTERPIPVVALMGLQPLKDKKEESIVSFLQGINREVGQYLLKFVPLPIEHQFPLKKAKSPGHPNNNDYTTGIASSNNRDPSSVNQCGILKKSWLKKHHDILPSAVAVFFQWKQEDHIIGKEIDRLKQSLSGRECKILLVFLEGNSQDTMNIPNVVEERISILKRRTDLDHKSFQLLRNNDIAPKSNVLEKLENSLRGYSLEYYQFQSKRVKKYKRILLKQVKGLHVRYSLKIGHYYEFQNQIMKMLKHYETAYEELINIRIVHDELNDNKEEKGKSEIEYTQVKTIGQFLNFKLCYHHLISCQNIKAAIDQFQKHMHVFRRSIGPIERSFEHWSWLSLQNETFSDLLLDYYSKQKNGNNNNPTTNSFFESNYLYQQPYLYYLIAAKFAILRRKTVDKLITNKNINRSIYVAMNFQLTHQLEYEGSDIIHSQLPCDFQTIKEYREKKELSFHHSQQIIDLLEKTIYQLKIISTPHVRLKTRLSILLGFEYLVDGNLVQARSLLEQGMEQYINEGWWSIVSKILKQLIICVYNQRHYHLYIDYNLRLLSCRHWMYMLHKEREKIQQSLHNLLTNPPMEWKEVTNCYIQLNKKWPVVMSYIKYPQQEAIQMKSLSYEIMLLSFFPIPFIAQNIEICFENSIHDLIIHHDTDMNLEFHPFKPFFIHKQMIPSLNQSYVKIREIKIKIQFHSNVSLTMGIPCYLSDSIMLQKLQIHQQHQQDDERKIKKFLKILNYGLFNGNKEARIEIQKLPVKASCQLYMDATLLKNEFCPMNLCIQAKEEKMNQITCYLTCDNKKDSFQFYIDIKDKKNKLQPLEYLQEKEQSFLTLPSLIEGDVYEQKIFFNSNEIGNHLIFLVIYYELENGAQMEMHMEKQIHCMEPFQLQTQTLSTQIFPFYDPVQKEDNKELMIFPLNLPVFSHFRMKSLSIKSITIHSLEFIKNDHRDISILNCVGELKQQNMKIGFDDEMTLGIQSCIKNTIINESIGKIKICWSTSNISIPVDTILDLPQAKIISPILEITTTSNASYQMGKAFEYCIHITNNSNRLQRIKLIITKNDNFLLSGLTSFLDYVQPEETVDKMIYLIPLSTGYLEIPGFKVVDEENKVNYSSEMETRQIFVSP